VDRDDTDPRVIIFTLWLVVFSIASQAIIIAPIIPTMARQLAVGEATLGTLITSYAVMVGIFSLVAGPISDYVGRRRMLLVGTAMMTGGLALHGLATDFATLFAVRAIAGVGGGLLNGAAIAYVGDYFPADRRGWANGWVFSGFAAGQIAGIPLGTILATELGFRWPFLAFAITMAGAFVLIYLVVPQPDVELAAELTVRSALAEYASLLRRPAVAAASLVFVIMFLGNSLYVTFLPTWLENTLGMSGPAIAGIFLVGGIANVIAGPRAGSLSDQVGRKPLIVGASLGIASVMFLTPYIAVTVVAVYVFFFFVMGLFSTRGTPFQTLLTEMVSGKERGALMSLTSGVGQFGSGFGGTVAAVAYTTVGYPGTTVIAALAMLVIAALVWRYLPETVGGEAQSPTEVLGDVTTTVAREAEGAERRIERSVESFLCRQTPDALYGPCHEAGHADPQRSTQPGEATLRHTDTSNDDDLETD